VSTKIICSECLKKQQEIDRLKDENASLKAKLRYQERQITEGFFTSQTPSSKKPFKPNMPISEKKKRGGAKFGHTGHGRESFNEEDADEIKRIKTFELCPDCGVKLEHKGYKRRNVIDIDPIYVKKIIYHLETKCCPDCQKKYTAQAPGVLPKCLFGNNLLTYIAVEHYLEGIPLGHLERKLDIGYGAMVKALHRVAKIVEEIPERLIERYRTAPVKHGDETGWRNDGQNGYGWLFTTPEVSIFRFRPTRSAKVVKDVLGTVPLPGVLVVDRYNGYNQAPCKIQYCYAHLLRNVQDLEKEFPDNEEIKTFVEGTAPLLAEAMHLRSLPITKKAFYRRAANTKSEIIKTMNAKANHPGIQKIQNIFRENQDRLYHWADDRNVPADNNFAERELRPLVISRKLSFGSHSENGAKTREIFMSVLVSLKKKEKGKVFSNFKIFLDQIACGTNKSPYEILFGKKLPPHQ
jgi:transposase